MILIIEIQTHGVLDRQSGNTTVEGFFVKYQFNNYIIYYNNL
jgi:hypothetical protein